MVEKVGNRSRFLVWVSDEAANCWVESVRFCGTPGWLSRGVHGVPDVIALFCRHASRKDIVKIVPKMNSW
jgi:hypothetical protein